MIEHLPRGNGMTLTLCKIAFKAEKEGKKVFTSIPGSEEWKAAMTEQGQMGAYGRQHQTCNEGAKVPKLDETPNTEREQQTNMD